MAPNLSNLWGVIRFCPGLTTRNQPSSCRLRRSR